MIVGGITKGRMISMSINFYDMVEKFDESEGVPFEGVSYDGVPFSVVCVPCRNDNEEIVIQRVTEYDYYAKTGTGHNPLVIVSCKDCNLEMRPVTTDWVVEVSGYESFKETYQITAKDEDEAGNKARDLFSDDHPDAEDCDIDDVYKDS